MHCLNVRILSVIALPFLGGCAEMTHLTRSRAIDNDSATYVDAKQRAIFTRRDVLCAEPSPDALSALAASNKLDVSTPQGTSVGDAFSIAEAAGSIGLRTQSIQLMRDHMYRLCEAYQNGAITPLTFELLHRRFQTTMIAILAIEQLTGVTKAPTIVLGGSAAAGNAEAVAKLTALKEDQAKAVTEAQSDYSTKEATENKAKSNAKAAQDARDAATGDAVTDAQSKLDAANKALADATAAKLDADGILAGRKASLAITDRQLTLAASTGSASATGMIGSDTRPDPVTTVAIANAVQAITDKAMGLENRSDFCFVLMSDAAQTNSKIDASSEVLKQCVELLKADVEYFKKNPSGDNPPIKSVGP